MKTQEFFCEKCGLSGHVHIEEHEDVMTAIHAIEDDHKAHSPECENPTAKIRVIAWKEAPKALPGAVKGIERASYDPRNPVERMLHDARFGTLVHSITAGVIDEVLTIRDYKDALDMAEYYLLCRDTGLHGAEAGRNSRAKLIEVLAAMKEKSSERDN